MKQAKSEPPVWFVLESSTQRIGSDPHRHQSAPSSRHLQTNQHSASLLSVCLHQWSPKKHIIGLQIIR